MSQEERAASGAPQNVMMYDRARLIVSGVEEVLSFDSERIVMRTVLGELSVAGSGLRVGRLSVESGEITVEGLVSELVYSGSGGEAGGLWSRLFG